MGNIAAADAGIGAGAGAPAAATAPTPHPALVGGVDGFDSLVAVDLSQGRPALARAELHLQLVIPLPLEVQLLRAQLLELSNATTDRGERIALMLAPRERRNRFLADGQPNRDRQLRLPIALSPPAQTASSLRAVHARVLLELSEGPRLQAEGPATIGTQISTCGALVTDRREASLQLLLPSEIAGGLSQLVGLDSDGHDLPSRTTSSDAPGGAAPSAAPARTATATLSCQMGHCASVRVEWYGHRQERTVVIDLPEVDLPDPLPAVGALADGGILWHAPAMAGLAHPLDEAISTGDMAGFQAALPQADLQAPDADGRRPLQRAAALGRQQMLLELLAAEAPVHAQDAGGWTALHAAVACGDEEEVAALLAAGANPRRELDDGRSCFDLARDLGRWRIVRQLLAARP